VTTLLRLDAHPLAAPHAWTALASHGADVTVVVNVADGPGSGRDASYTAAMGRLAAAGVRLLGYVDLEFATRPAAAVIADVHRWAGYPVQGVFFDRTPASPYLIGPVAVAVQAARRSGLPDAVLNPGAPVDRIYRDLDVAICVFEGSWEQYEQWDATGSQPGDGHLVHGVPFADLAAARQLLTARGATFGLVSDVPQGCGLPTWVGRPTTADFAAAAGISDTRTTTGS
jgi:hypothetical protein